ncbi:hypothetical protein PENSTE_c017G07537 [Penicillium steckii]|uniref:F-box domain-containing protein n=1 Tax=Penicillium steckii TaxID=303698 RepID=A0A1V6SX95_9EURO|nr:hypothetical protein PENSTE_c017G07537 [Penicillium steckii]
MSNSKDTPQMKRFETPTDHIDDPPHLPNEIILPITQYLNHRAIAGLMRVNRNLYNLLKGDLIYDRTPGSSRNGIIIWASQHGREDVVRAMLERQGEFGRRDWNDFGLITGKSEPTSELQEPLRIAAWSGHVRIIKLLLDWDILIIRNDLQSLPFAVGCGRLEAVKVLLEYSAKVSGYISDSNPASEDELLIEEGYSDSEVLSESDHSSSNEPDESSSNERPLIDRRHGKYLDQALEWAIQRGEDEIIEVLLQDQRVQISLFTAARLGSERFVKYCSLHEKPNVITPRRGSPLTAASKAGHVNVLQILFEAGWNANLRDDQGKSTLCVAAEYGQEAVVKMLLDRDVDADVADEEGVTPFMEAARNGHTGIIELLVNTSSVNLNSVDSLGRNALHYVVEKGNGGAVRLLLSAGADPDNCDNLGRSPLSLAAQSGFPGIVRLLLGTDGVDPNSKCQESRTPLAYAVLSGRFPGRVNGERINANDVEDEKRMLDILQELTESRLSTLSILPETEENGAALSIMKDLLADPRSFGLNFFHLHFILHSSHFVSSSFESSSHSSKITIPPKELIYLPPEIILMIIDCLLAEDPAAVLSLAMTSKAYHVYCQRSIQSAVKSLLFHDIKIPIPLENAELKEIVDRLVDRLEAADAFDRVRRVFIENSRMIESEPLVYLHEFDDEWEPPSLSTLLSPGEVDKYTTQFAGWQDTLLPKYRPAGEYLVQDWNIEENAYKIVVDLIEALPNLTDLIWTWSNRIPMSILNTLHRHQPQCRLHLNYYFKHAPRDTDDTARELQMDSRRLSDKDSWYGSPSVHSIRASRDSGSHHPNLDILSESIVSAKSLKELRFATNTIKVPTWLPDEPLSRRLSLQVLHFESRFSFDADTLCEWSRFVNFSALQSLKIHGLLKDHSFDRWSRMRLSFPSLRNLRLNLSSEKSDWRSADFYHSANEFLHSVPRLIELELDGWQSLVDIKSLVDYHGPNLRKFKILDPAGWQIFNEETIRLINTACPLIEELGVPITRRQDELGLYLALASFRNLKTLYLHYEILPPRIHEIPKMETCSGGLALDDPALEEPQSEVCPSVRYMDIQLQYGHVERIIFDAMIDDKLACDIFKVISDATPSPSTKLSDLTILVTGPRYGSTMKWIVERFGRSWHVKRIPDISSGRDYSIKARYLMSTDNEESDEEGRSLFLTQAIFPISNRIFPPRSANDPDDDIWEYYVQPGIPTWSPRSPWYQGKKGGGEEI